MSKSIVHVQRHAGGVQIWISIEDIIELAEVHPDNPLKITDTDKFVEAYIEQLENYAQSNDVEVGCSHLEYLLEECIQQVYEEGHECIEPINDEE